MAGRRKLVTDADWMEHHAKYFSAAILMPKTPFMNAVSDLAGNGRGSGVDLQEKLADIFQVSPASVKIRLSQLGFNKYVFRNERTQDEKQYKILLQMPCERQGAIIRKCLSTRRVTVLWQLFFTYDVNQVIDRKGAMPD